jgi:hypothetical protein
MVRADLPRVPNYETLKADVDAWKGDWIRPERPAGRADPAFMTSGAARGPRPRDRRALARSGVEKSALLPAAIALSTGHQ